VRIPIIRTASPARRLLTTRLHRSEAAPPSELNYALVGCTVAPGFDFADFELASRAALLRQFPAAAEDIRLLTTEDAA
jgi:predicted cupin superfamily sugar epimerase